MRALVLEDLNSLALREITRPRVDDGEVLVQVEWSGICGTDVHGYVHGPPLRLPPIIMGHEFTGTVDGTSTRVVVNPRLPCGSCPACGSGRTQQCAQATTLGVHRQGGFAQWVAVPARNCIPIPADLDSRLAALTEPVAVGLHASNVLAAHVGLEGASVGVVGAGVIGLAVALECQRYGARVTIVDLSRERRQQAFDLGVERVEEALDEIQDATVDAVGRESARAATLSRLAPGGAALWIGLGAAPAQVDVAHLVRGERRIVASYCYTDAEFAAAVRRCAQFRGAPLEILTLEQGSAAFERLSRGTAATAGVRTLFTLAA